MSSNVNCCSKLIDCDSLIVKYGSVNGSLDIDDFTKMIGDLFNQPDEQIDSPPPPPPIDQVIKVFNHFDLDGNGYIDEEEFKFMWIKWLTIIMEPKSSLIVVDVQNDFISGSLALEHLPNEVNCSSIIPLINLLIDQCSFEMIVYTLDWHPENHISFVDNVNQRKLTNQLKENQFKPFDCVSFDIDGVERNQIVYPIHCVQSSWGSQLHDDLKIINGAIKIYKGTNPDIDSYSAFKDNEGLNVTQLDEQLRYKGITDVYICGLAYDICVYYTIKDSLELNYRTIMVEDCCKGTDNNQIKRIRQELIEKGCLIVNSNQVQSMVSGRIKYWQLAYQSACNLINSK